ncbi:hypothetical protein [Neobacillus notoginsengisoli]|nr:hypothetical protein [Neobacillus notoginsengisoli]
MGVIRPESMVIRPNPAVIRPELKISYFHYIIEPMFPLHKRVPPQIPTH